MYGGFRLLIRCYRLGRDGSDGYCDCIGLVIGAIRRSGGQWRGIHGTNWTARNAMHDLNPLRGAGQLQRGELVFRAHEPGTKGYALPSRYASSADRRDYYHVGVVMQTNPLRILHCSGGGVKADHKREPLAVPRDADDVRGADGADANRRFRRRGEGPAKRADGGGFPLPLHGADGNFGAETEQALRQFQQKSGLSASGAADAETLAALRLLNG